MVHHQIKIIETNGKEIAVLSNDTHISKWVEKSGRLDHDQNMLPRILKYISKGDTVVDAGAFIGDHTVAYAEAVGESGMVYAFEPNPVAYECLAHNCKPYKQVFGVNAALGSHCEKAALFLSDNAGATHVFKAEHGIQTIRLDDMSLSRCDFIKIDVEGYEPKVLYGAKETIKRFHPRMLIEVNRGALQKQHGYTPLHIYTFLEDNGYKWSNIYEGQKEEGNQYDIICE